jgi:hypothetical protein
MINKTSSGGDISGSNLFIGSQDNGCCGDTLTPCQYSASTTANVTAITSITITKDGASKTLTIAETITQNSAKEARLAIEAALYADGLIFNHADIKVYNNSFANDTLTFEFISGLPITAFVINGATSLSITQKCNDHLACMHRFTYTPTEAISIFLDNVDLGLSTYATAALLKTAITNALTSNSITGFVDVRADGSNVDVWLWTVDITNVIVNTPFEGGENKRIDRAFCQMKFI